MERTKRVDSLLHLLINQARKAIQRLSIKDVEQHREASGEWDQKANTKAGRQNRGRDTFLMRNTVTDLVSFLCWILFSPPNNNNNKNISSVETKPVYKLIKKM